MAMNRNSFFLRLFLGNLLLVGAIIALLAVPVVTIVGGGLFVRNILSWLVVIGLAVAAVLGLLVNLIWFSPLRQVTQAARKIAGGNLSDRVRPFGPAELQQLAGAMNEMRGNLSRQIETIDSQREGLRTVVENLREGVIAADASGRILLANQIALELLGCRGLDQSAGLKVDSVVPVMEVLDLYHKARDMGTPSRRQVEVEVLGRRRQLDVQASLIPSASPQGIACLLILYDITDITQIATVKAEFVANASHELKTPLATLRMAIESLDAIGPGDQDEFRKLVDMLNRHVGRLEDLTRDLLDLHSLERGPANVRSETIHAEALLQWAKIHFADHAGTKGLSLILDGDAGLAFTSDRTLLELVLQNLLENAIKFTPAGGSVHLVIGRQGLDVAFTVSDTGCGIAPEVRTRVFERFFQVNPARSGEPRVRGTGLGLAIVKHAAERLGGKLDLQSQLGQGTTITLTIPPGHTSG
jgi:PAS domain S-box-containing protein